MFNTRQTLDSTDQFDANTARNLADRKDLEEILSTIRYEANQGKRFYEFYNRKFADTVVESLKKLGFGVKYSRTGKGSCSGIFSTYVSW